MAEAWRSKPFPQTVACQICTLELTIPSAEVIPFLSCEACGATPCARLCGRWFASEQGAAKHTLSCGRMASKKPKPPASPPRQASTLPVHGLLEGAAPPAPSPVVTPPPPPVAAPTARDAAAARAAAAAPKPKPKPKARPKKRVKREAPPPEPVKEVEPLPPLQNDNEVADGAALASLARPLDDVTPHTREAVRTAPADVAVLRRDATAVFEAASALSFNRPRVDGVDGVRGAAPVQRRRRRRRSRSPSPRAATARSAGSRRAPI